MRTQLDKELKRKIYEPKRLENSERKEKSENRTVHYLRLLYVLDM